MKTLHKDFAGINRQFIWNDSAEKNEGSASLIMKELKDVVKDKSIQSLESLKADNEAATVLNNTYLKLDKYRKDLLNGEVTPPKIKENDMQKEVEAIFSQEVDQNLLKEDLGMSVSLDKADTDTDLDLDEFEKSRDFVGDNMEIMMRKIIEDLASLPNTPEQTKLINIFKKISTEIAKYQQELNTGTKNETERAQLEQKIEDVFSLELSKGGFDMGKMLEEYAKLAKKSPNVSGDNIDAILKEFTEENKPIPQSETANAPVGSMEELYMQNLELAKFLAEYYPNEMGRTFEQDLADAKVTKLSQLPEFFLNTKLGKESESIKEKLKNYDKNPAGFAALKAKIEADNANAAPSRSPLEGAKDIFRDLLTDMQSYMPASCRHFKFTDEDVANANSASELFENKINSLFNKTNKAGKGVIEFQGIKDLARPLNLKDDAKMIQRFEKDIPLRYQGEWGEKYRQALIDGKTRKNFGEWIDSNESGITKMEKLGTWFTNIQYWLLKLGVMIGWDGAQDKLDKWTEEHEKKSELSEKIKAAVDEVDKKDDAKKVKASWEGTSATPADKANFQKFHTDYANLLAFPDANDAEKTKEIVSLSDFRDKWNTPKSREILDWAKMGTFSEKINLDNFKFIAENTTNLNIVDKVDPKTKKIIKDANGKPTKVLKFTRDDLADRYIETWKNESIAKARKDTPREAAFKKLISPEEGLGIFDDSVDDKYFVKNRDKLFKNPENPESSEFRPLFKSLFGEKLKIYRGDYQITSADLDMIIANAEERLDNGFDSEISTGASDTDYYDSVDGKLITVDEGINTNTGEKHNEGADKNTFEVDFNEGWKWNGDSLYDRDFGTLEAFMIVMRDGIT